MQEERRNEGSCKMLCVRTALVVVFLTFLRLPGSTSKDCSDFTVRSCEECLENTDCLWCFDGEQCMNYPIDAIIPPSSLCPLRDARWAVCWVNFEILIIVISIVGGLILLPLVCCCCYCCFKFKRCCQKKSCRPDEEELRLARQREERKRRNEQRKSDMKARYEEIRKKYGLSEPVFHRFENE
ncbi:pituitary tumor-transforming gene 1 protein-interacting protein-like [Mobula birostris]|uniref:pituitary tumor-transforming gene 1 protein-interacting protein-like n=1 Tax=Mobula birostris TaxID=1983395 RepID=UPI003B28D0AE